MKNEYDMVIRENWVSLYVFATVSNRSWKSVPWDHEPIMAYEECSQSLTCECFIVTSTLGVSIYLTMYGHMHRLCQMLLELQVKCGLSHPIGLQSWQTTKASIHTAEKASTLLHVASFSSISRQGTNWCKLLCTCTGVTSQCWYCIPLAGSSASTSTDILSMYEEGITRKLKNKSNVHFHYWLSHCADG